MKKRNILFNIMVSVSIVLMLAISVNAESSVLKGTPSIDGVMDEIYLQSVEIVAGEAFYSSNDDKTTDITGKARLLYDDKYFYVCIEVKDDDVLSAGDDYINSSENPWENDAIELWTDEGMSGTNYKTSFDALGKKIYGGPLLPGFENVIAKTVKSDSGYTMEFALPLEKKGVSGASYGFALQINDYFKDAHVVAVGIQAPEEYKFGKDVVIPETTIAVTEAVTLAPVTEAVTLAANETLSAPSAVPTAIAVTDAPQTSDLNMSIIFILFALSCTFILVVCKQRKKQ